MNTRSTQRSNYTTNRDDLAEALKSIATDRQKQQKVVQIIPQEVEEEEEEEEVVEDVQEVEGEEVVEETAEEAVEEEVIDETEDNVNDEDMDEEVNEQDMNEEAVNEEEVNEEEVNEEEVNEEIGEEDNNQAFMDDSVEAMANESAPHSESVLADDLANYWTEENNLRDGKLEFVCKWLLCSFRTQSECSIRKHAVKHQKPYVCSFTGCGERFVDTQDLMVHFNGTHMDTNAFKCTFADCDQRFRDLKSLTAHRVSHVSHTTQLIKANKDYKPVSTRSRTLAADMQPNSESITTIELSEGLTADQSYTAIISTDIESQPNGANEHYNSRYRNNRLNSVIRCPISSLTDDIVEGNDNYVKCRSFDGKFWYKCLWDYCDYGNVNEGIIRRHVLKHEFPHKCSFDACSKSFATLSEMAEHRQLTHSGDHPYSCDWPECTDAFACLKDLTEHKRTHLLAQAATCVTTKVKKVKQPVQPKPFTCDFGKCHMHYATEEELEVHKQIHAGDRPWKCTYADCTFAAKSKDKLQIHHSRHSAVKTFRCLWPTCDKSFTISEQLRRHRKVHTNRPELICEFTDCDLMFTTADDLEKHLRRHIGLDDKSFEAMNQIGFKCNFGLCKMHFSTKEELRTHSQSHRGERLFKCGFDNKCTYSAKTLDKLTSHLRYHSGERPFKCDFIGCHQDFIQSHHLARHRKSHFGDNTTPTKVDDTEDKPFVCEFGDCTQEFATEQDLDTHFNSDHPIVEDKSKQNIKSKQKSNKRKNIIENESQNDDSVEDLIEIGLDSDEGVQPKKSKTNRKPRKKFEISGESKDSLKPIACSFGKCNFKCNTDEELTEHTDRLHSGDRPFVCEYDGCTFKTNRKDKLTIHTRRHTGEKPYTCDWNGCERSFISREQLNRHNLSHFKSKQSSEMIDKDFDRTLKELDELLQECDEEVGQ